MEAIGNKTSTTVEYQRFTVRAVLEFGRPHTIIGTLLAITVLFLINSGSSTIFVLFNWDYLWLCVITFATNYYIVGLNQIIDVDIDQINKPYLPLANATLKQIEAIILTSTAGFFALLGSWLSDIYLGITITLSLFIGTLYSVEPIRLKRRGILGSLAIVLVRSIILNIGISFHILDVFNQPMVIQTLVWYLLVVTTLVSIVISVFKDIPDLEGDDIFGIKTTVSQLGKSRIFNLSRILIYTAIIAGAVMSLLFWHSMFLAISHLILLVAMIWIMEKTVLENNQSVVSSYKSIWNLFYLIYILSFAVVFL